MLFKLFTLLCIGLGAAGLVLLVARPLKLKNVGKLAPLVAAVAVISYETWSRYTWVDRVSGALPAGSVVIETYPYHGWLEPWTAYYPRIGSMLVLDGAATMTRPDNPALRLIVTKLLEQDEETLKLTHLVDCVGGRRILAPSPEILQQATPPDAAWIDEKNSPLLRAACRD